MTFAKIGGVTTQRERTRVKRVPLLRAFEARHRDGKITPKRGGYVKPAGTDEDKRYVGDERLVRNIGDQIMVTHSLGIAVVEVVRIEGGWLECWDVKLVAGDAPANSNVWLMPGFKVKL